jgi:hypothetical protein
MLLKALPLQVIDTCYDFFVYTRYNNLALILTNRYFFVGRLWHQKVSDLFLIYLKKRHFDDTLRSAIWESTHDVKKGSRDNTTISHGSILVVSGPHGEGFPREGLSARCVSDGSKQQRHKTTKVNLLCQNSCIESLQKLLD